MATETIAPAAGSGRLWQGQTPDARAADRRQRLVEAGLELVGTQGVTALTMRAACREAAVGPRYFYDLFADRDELLAAVYDEAVERIREPILAAAVAVNATDGVAAALLEAFDTAVAVVEDDPRIGRVLFRESAADETLRPRSQAAMPEFVLSVLAELVPEEAEALRQPSRAWTVIGFSAAIFALFLAWSEGARHTPRAEFVHHCARLAVDQLGLDIELPSVARSGGRR
ncbi:TetR/AcrR family transcriptional regulator [Nocardioides bizhenqiangii]|uniref:TetR/AcrR family transcriptional regulator n=1 Tax=Nocardioides bizhenqiangii TaxID=3095076 RepID=A0ABZ0ZVL6_9ACTN|nr:MULTISPECIES: TetR/AcrR family transcriptional regulator [unclassified Nocardioides]MDZ5622480.1 TetR/AcrR family transcriptional regulator [Nocardioides sp. HM23]WQQ28361.1 TetR/AcrR family transcriptional regulator [Nocardioides sp. HM61]